MDTASISVISALAGSVIGGLTSGLATWLGNRFQVKAGYRLHKVTQRQKLYRDFLMAASEAYGATFSRNEPSPNDIVALHAMVSSMRIVSSSEVVVCAEKTVCFIIDKYGLPGKTFLEVRELMRSGEIVDPFQEFSQVSRDELIAM